jgi:hypothetical protein
LQWDGFVSAIIEVTLDGNQAPEIRVAACIVIKDLVKLHLGDLSAQDKELLRIWAVEAPLRMNLAGAVSKLLKEAVFQLVSIEYPRNWPNLPETIYLKLTNARGPEEIRAVLLLMEAVVKYSLSIGL